MTLTDAEFAQRCLESFVTSGYLLLVVVPFEIPFQEWTLGLFLDEDKQHAERPAEVVR